MISEKLFKKMIEDGVFAEWREYKTKSGTWYYGSLLADYRGRKKVIILTPDGYKKIQNIISNNKISFLPTFLSMVMPCFQYNRNLYIHPYEH